MEPQVSKEEVLNDSIFKNQKNSSLNIKRERIETHIPIVCHEDDLV